MSRFGSSCGTTFSSAKDTTLYTVERPDVAHLLTALKSVSGGINDLLSTVVALGKSE